MRDNNRTHNVSWTTPVLNVRWFSSHRPGLRCLFTASLLLCACGTAPRPVQPRLTLFGLGLEAGELLRQDALDEFTRTTGIQAELIPTPGASAQQLSVMLDLLQRKAVSPDIYLIDTVWPGTLHEYLEDLTPYLDTDSLKHFPTLLENNTIAGRLVCLPFYMNVGVLYYRLDLLKRYGYASPPETWTELERVALRIQQGERARGNRGFWGYIWQGAAYEGLTCNALEWQASFGGGRIIENDGTVSVNNVPTARAMTTAARWVGAISPPGVLAYNEGDALNVFRSGSAAFMRHWSSAYRSVTREMQPSSVGIAVLPAGPQGRTPVLGGFQLGVSRDSLHKRDAAKLVSYLSGKTVQKRRALRRGILPTYSDLYQQPDFAVTVPAAGVVRVMSSGTWVLRPSSVAGRQYAEASRLYYERVHQILSRQAPVQRALSELERSLQELLQTRNPLPPK